jgi:hypothetical protein
MAFILFPHPLFLGLIFFRMEGRRGKMPVEQGNRKLRDCELMEEKKPYHGLTRIRRDRESGEFTAETRRRGEETGLTAD